MQFSYLYISLRSRPFHDVGWPVFGSLGKGEVDGSKSSQNVTSCFCNHFPIIQSHYVCKYHYVLNILELNWNQRFRYKNTKLKICHHMLTLSTMSPTKQVISRRGKNEKTSASCPKIKKCTCIGCKIIYSRCQICKLLPSTCLLKLRIAVAWTTWENNDKFCIFFLLSPNRWYQINSGILWIHFASIVT